MPFGLANAPSTFQSAMDATLGKLLWTTALIYLDDILIFASTFEKHIQRLRLVFDKLEKTG